MGVIYRYMYIFHVSVGGEIKVGQSFIFSLLVCLFTLNEKKGGKRKEWS